MLAATLACGEGSVVSHGTAAFLLGLWEWQPRSIDVIGPVEAGRRLRGIERRHTPPPPPSQKWLYEAVPCTSPSRTIVDVAGIVREPALRRTIEQTAVVGMLDIPEIDAILAGARRRGSRALRLILEDWRRYQPSIRVRSVFEARLLSTLSQHDIPAPECNARLTVGQETFEIDFLWRRQCLAVETDGGKYHDNPSAKARDRRRDRLLAGAGYEVWRLRWKDLEQRSTATMAKLARRLRCP